MRRKQHRGTWLLMAVLGLTIEAVYCAVWLSQFYLPAFYATPLLDLGKLTGYAVGAGLVFVANTIILFGLYYAAFRIVHRLSGADGATHYRGLIIAFGVLFSATLLMVYPYGAADVFDYIFYGRIITHYGASPFLFAPSHFAGDAFLPYVAWRDLPFTYGPLWAAFSAPMSRIGGDSLLANLILYKGLGIAFYVASLALIDSILRRIAPRYESTGLLLFAWNPLVVMETAGNGHNDVVMMFFVLLAVRLMLARDLRPHPFALAAVAASVLVKFITAIVAPLFAVWLLAEPGPMGRRLLRLVVGGSAALLLAVAAYGLFWQGPATFAVQRRDELFTVSLPALLKLILEGPFRIGDAKFVGPLFLVPFGLYCVAEALRLGWSLKHYAEPLGNETGSRIPPLRSGDGGYRSQYGKLALLIAASYRVTLIYLLFACLWFQPWYLVWLLALAAIRPGLDVAHQSMLFSFTATLNYFVFDYVWIWNATRLDFLAVQIIAVTTVYTLPIAFGLWLRRRKTGAPSFRTVVVA